MSIVETASIGKAPAADSAESMIGIGTFIDRRRDVRHFGTGRDRRGDHRFEHLRRDHDRLAGAPAGAGDLLLDARNLLQRHFHAEIAAGDHQRIRNLDDLGEALHGLGLLDLRHDAGTAGCDLAHLGDVVRTLHEGKGDPVDLGRKRGVEIGAVLGGQRAGADRRIGDGDALAVGQAGADLDRRQRRRAIGRDGDDAQAHLAVVDEEAVTRLERLEDFGVRKEDAAGRSRCRVGIEREGLADGNLDRLVGEGAEAKLRALQVGEDADRPALLRADGADRGHEFAQLVMRGVAHVDAEDVGTGLEQRRDDRLVG